MTCGSDTVTKYVYGFHEGSRDMADELGGKGANLAEMTKLGMPVPPGFTISTDACRFYLDQGRTPPELTGQVAAALSAVESEVGRSPGDAADPLLMSVRSGARFSMPGMMETVLDIGLNDDSVRGLVAMSGNEPFAWDSYRRLIQMFGSTVLGIDSHLFEQALEQQKETAGVTLDKDLDVPSLHALVDRYKAIVVEATGESFPQDPMEQREPEGRDHDPPGGSHPGAGTGHRRGTEGAR
jgi:pyruvate, orthophosphate dikinase